MKMDVQVTGLDKAQRKLQGVMDDVAGARSEKFVTLSAKGVEARTAPYVPIDTGELVNSAYTQTTKTWRGWTSVFGYAAVYGKWVHEMPGTLKGQPREHFGKTRKGKKFGGGTQKGNYWDPDGEPQFLAKGVEEFIAEDLDAFIELYLKD